MYRNTVLNQSTCIFALDFGSKKKASTALEQKYLRVQNLLVSLIVILTWWKVWSIKLVPVILINFIANKFDYLYIKIYHVEKNVFMSEKMLST